MRRAEAAAAGGHESNGTAGQKPDQPGDIALILQRDMVMHEARQPGQPGCSAADFAAAAIVHAHEPSCRCGVNLTGKGLDRGQSFRRRIAAARENDHVGLTDRLARPGRSVATAEINHQRRGLLEFVEPIGDFGGIQCPPRKRRLDTRRIDDLGVGPGEGFAHAPIEAGWNGLEAAIDQRHRPCHRRGSDGRQALGSLGKAQRQRREQPIAGVFSARLW
jgi:hypothetical protein